ncbi:MAG TPA: hypothetical protein VEQ35_00945 [Beijerinckia sp.]|nr:hypothetical protein [Beijerinckia sp.]
MAADPHASISSLHRDKARPISRAYRIGLRLHWIAAAKIIRLRILTEGGEEGSRAAANEKKTCTKDHNNLDRLANAGGHMWILAYIGAI